MARKVKVNRSSKYLNQAAVDMYALSCPPLKTELQRSAVATAAAREFSVVARPEDTRFNAFADAAEVVVLFSAQLGACGVVDVGTVLLVERARTVLPLLSRTDKDGTTTTVDNTEHVEGVLVVANHSHGSAVRCVFFSVVAEKGFDEVVVDRLGVVGCLVLSIDHSRPSRCGGH